MPDDVGFATKITHGRRMLARALDAGVPAAWATADEFYGSDRGLRRDLQARGLGYVLAVAKNHRVTLPAGSRQGRPGRRQLPARPGTGSRPARAPKANASTTGPGCASPHPPTRRTGHHWLLVRRRITDGELAFYRCWSPTPRQPCHLVRVAGTRWCVEECFQAGKSEVGLDQHQVRKWTSWYRYTTLVMLAHALLAVIAAHERIHRPSGRDADPVDCQRNPSPLRETDHHHVRSITYWLHWSGWRRRHQARARTSHGL